uniref:Uncharacterized protein n=1 Tax=Rhizophora mucronata TaxID=61149 RepID=A0A2P2IK21_RHIMU
MERKGPVQDFPQYQPYHKKASKCKHKLLMKKKKAKKKKKRPGRQITENPNHHMLKEQLSPIRSNPI